MLEDLVGAGGSSLRCAEALRAEGTECCRYWLFSATGWDQAETAFATARIPLATLATFSDLQAVAAERSLLDAGGLGALAAWRPDPAAWSARFDRTGGAR